MGPDITHGERGRDPWVDRLSEYVDGELAGAERTALEAHAASCSACTAALEDLRAVVSRAHALVDTPPAEDLWPGIASQIATAEAAAPARAAQATTHRMWWTRRFEFGVPQLAAAAVLLVALSACAVWFVVRGTAPVPAGIATSRPQAIASRPGGPASPGVVPGQDGRMDAVGATTTGATTPTAVPAIATNPGYDASIASLEQALDEGRGRLDPKTLRVIERNLRVIDQALAEARAAVAADPNNTWLQSHLAATMKRKADLLRTATLLTTAHG